MQAPDRPRRPIRRMQRTRGSFCARPRTTSQVPSGELSSTNTTSQAMSVERRVQPPVQDGDVVALVEGGDDDRKLRQTGGLRRVFGARFDGFIHGASVYPQPSGMPRQGSGNGPQMGENGPKRAPKCQRPRTEGARTSGAAKPFMVVPAPEPLSINVAVRSKIGMPGAFRKGVAAACPASINWALPGSPVPAAPGAAGAIWDGCWTAAGLGAGLPNCPIGP